MCRVIRIKGWGCRRTKELKNKKKLHPNYIVGIILIVAGLVVIALDVLLPIDTLDVVFNVGIGVTVIVSGVISFITGYFENSRWIFEHMLRHTIIYDLMYDQAESMKCIRYNQSIDLTILPLCTEKQGDEVNSFVKIKCQHQYTYKNEYLVKQNIDIDIFNDIFIPASKTNGKPYEHTAFEWVKFDFGDGNPILYKKENNDGHFEIQEDGRPRFRKTISLSKGKQVTITYSIINKFELFSRLVWYIQELSENVRILISHSEQAPDISKFEIRINHPCRQKLLKNNEAFISPNCHLKISENENGCDCNIFLDKPFLPYQGFELKWDL